MVLVNTNVTLLIVTIYGNASITLIALKAYTTRESSGHATIES